MTDCFPSQLVLQRLRQRASNAMLSIARRPSANAAKTTARIRQEHEQDDLLHLANRTQLRRVTITSPAISTPTLATGTSASQTPPGPASDPAGNGYMWNAMPEMGEGRDAGDVDVVNGAGTGNTSPRPDVNIAFDHRTNPSISPADAFRAGPSRTNAGNGSRHDQHLRSFRPLPRSRPSRHGREGTTLHQMEIAQQVPEQDPQSSSNSIMSHTLLSGGPLSPEDHLNGHTHAFQQASLQARLPVASGTGSRSRHSLRELPFEHMNAFGMPMIMDPSNQNSSNRSQSQANIFRSNINTSDNQPAAQPSVFQGGSTHHREFDYRAQQHQRPAQEGILGNRHSDTLLYQPPTLQHNSALPAHPENHPSPAGHSNSAYQHDAEYPNAALSMDMDMRFRAMGDMGSLSGMHSLDSIDMEMGMDMDNMPLLPAGGSLHDVEQFIAGWHDQ